MQRVIDPDARLRYAGSKMMIRRWASISLPQTAALLLPFFLTGPQAFAAPDARDVPPPIVAQRMDGPYTDPQKLCARFRKQICEEIRFPERDHKSTCTSADLPGSLAPGFLAVRTVTAGCDNGDTLCKTHLAVQTSAGWFLYSGLPAAGFQHHTEELLDIKSLDGKQTGDAPLLTLQAHYSCNQCSAGGDERYMYSRTAHSELLLIIGVGPSGRPSAALQEVGSALTVEGLADSRGSDHKRMLWEDSIKQEWSLLPGPLLQLEPPQITQGAKQKRVLPTNEEEPLCYWGSLGKRKGEALHRSGAHPVRFR